LTPVVLSYLPDVFTNFLQVTCINDQCYHVSAGSVLTLKYNPFSLKFFIYTVFWISSIGFKSGQNGGNLSRQNPSASRTSSMQFSGLGQKCFTRMSSDFDMSMSQLMSLFLNHDRKSGFGEFGNWTSLSCLLWHDALSRTTMFPGGKLVYQLIVKPHEKMRLCFIMVFQWLGFWVTHWESTQNESDLPPLPCKTNMRCWMALLLVSCVCPHLFTTLWVWIWVSAI
jgi:hypothetical protein